MSDNKKLKAILSLVQAAIANGIEVNEILVDESITKPVITVPPNVAILLSELSDVLQQVEDQNGV